MQQSDLFGDDLPMDTTRACAAAARRRRNPPLRYWGGTRIRRSAREERIARIYLDQLRRDFGMAPKRGEAGGDRAAPVPRDTDPR